MTTHTKFAATRVRVTHDVCGSQFDPYGIDKLTVRRYGVEHVFTSHALFACKYERDGEIIVDYDDSDIAAELAFEEATGAAPHQWMHWYETRIYQPDPMDAYYGF